MNKRKHSPGRIRPRNVGQTFLPGEVTEVRLPTAYELHIASAADAIINVLALSEAPRKHARIFRAQTIAKHALLQYLRVLIEDWSRRGYCADRIMLMSPDERRKFAAGASEVEIERSTKEVIVEVPISNTFPDSLFDDSGDAADIEATDRKTWNLSVFQEKIDAAPLPVRPLASKPVGISKCYQEFPVKPGLNCYSSLAYLPLGTVVKLLRSLNKSHRKTPVFRTHDQSQLKHPKNNLPSHDWSQFKHPPCRISIAKNAL